MNINATMLLLAVAVFHTAQSVHDGALSTPYKRQAYYNQQSPSLRDLDTQQRFVHEAMEQRITLQSFQDQPAFLARLRANKISPEKIQSFMLQTVDQAIANIEWRDDRFATIQHQSLSVNLVSPRPYLMSIAAVTINWSLMVDGSQYDFSRTFPISKS